MKKFLLSAACVAALMPAFTASAQDAITVDWQTDGMVLQYSGNFGNNVTANANNQAMIDAGLMTPGIFVDKFKKGASCSRFMTVYGGDMYTVDMKNEALVKITKTGFEKVADLPELTTKVLDTKGQVVKSTIGGVEYEAASFYGTAITVDEAGNFLIGQDFTNRPASSLNFTVFNPTSGEAKNFTLPVPDGWNVGRLDCLGRVLGDLTKEAYFFIAPETGAYTQEVRIIKVTGDGTIASAEMTDAGAVAVAANYTQKGFAVPKYATLAEAKAADAVTDFYYSACAGANQYNAEYTGGKLISNFAPDMYYIVKGGQNGFDSFVAGGKRYFVRSQAETAGTFAMGVVVMDENGDQLAQWINDNYTVDGGDETIVAVPNVSGKVDIYVYNACNNTGGAAAKLTFDPALASEPIKPEIPEGSEFNPYKISTPQDLANWGKKMAVGKNYFVFENDIDMTGVDYAAPLGNNNFSGVYIFIDGKNHVVKNLTVSKGDYPSLVGVFHGEIRNLGLENINVTTGWAGGTFGGFVGHANYPGVTIVDNCFATGKVSAAAYGGGIGGYSNGKVKITNTYSNVEVTGGASYGLGAFYGWVSSGEMTLENVYAAGSVINSAGPAASFVGNSGIAVNITNAVAWCKSVNGSTAANAVCSGTPVLTNVKVWNEMKVNGQLVSNGVALADLQSTVTSWEVFNNKLNDGMPVLAWQAANGNANLPVVSVPGDTEENPYKIESASDLVNMGKAIGALTEFYVSLENDIDMNGVTYTPPMDGGATAEVFFQGNNHTISNLSINSARAGLFGNFKGEIHNLAIDNFNGKSLQWGVSGAFIGYVGGKALLDNCSSTGTSNGYYAGGLVGGINNNYDLTISNCYSTVASSGQNGGFTGGLLGRINAGGKLTVSNSYASGNISGATAGGIFGDHNGAAAINFDNVIIWCPEITGSGTANAIAGLGALEVNTSTVNVWTGTKVNGVAVADGKPTSELLPIAQSWEAFAYNEENKNVLNGRPLLSWQKGNGETTGIDSIVADEADEAEAVYYNLQGVRVDNPENGVYIRVQGSKASKVLVR